MTATMRNMTAEQQQEMQLPALNPPRPGPGPETTLQWTDGTAVSSALLKMVKNLPVMWTVHDIILGQVYVATSEQRVCGRVFQQLPATGEPVRPEDVQPGIWYFDCNKPAPFICESKFGVGMGGWLGKGGATG